MVTDKTRRSEFIEQNLGLVHSCAGRFRGRGIEYDDLYSAGCMGLVKACDAFDPERGVCFSTYAVPVILGEIKKLFRDGGTENPSLKDIGYVLGVQPFDCTPFYNASLDFADKTVKNFNFLFSGAIFMLDSFVNENLFNQSI